ncbi:MULTISPECIES: NADP transhydrogenase subunit beta [unclassified Burkholderia]|uniref:NADP transhydrogenase subunit beta n=1 Tax=unclassified Burkholderia TaxID=2613784 RepID=UPI000F5620B2|nr:MULTISPECIES: NADP transhydrogenase subunit beta [unclassified Burkholderia]RQR33645.1 NADP transhydrogenase subunit beta [Burkholderia sp. Bp9142]RQR45745.1 NADP transhydrogenase subunit beta [Burkholderia sp. Bp9140]
MPDWASFITWSGLERLELCVFVFAGALVIAITATVLVNRLTHGRRNTWQGAPGDKVIDMVALGLCVWIGYAFVNEPAQTPGIVALFAVSLLAAALGAHVMLTMHEHHARAPAHCGMSPRRGATLRLAWDGDPSHLQPADDFTQHWTWSINPRRAQPRCASSARNAQMTHATMRVRSRQRHQAKRH